MSENEQVDLLAPMVFKEEQIAIPVTVQGKEYVLKEATGDAATKYRERILRATVLGPDGKPTKMNGVASADPYLLSLCLFTKNGHPVPESTIRSWSNRVYKALFERLLTISEMEVQQETIEALEEKLTELKRQQESAKNVPDDSLAGSESPESLATADQ